MNEYARQALEKISTAMRLVASYFSDEKEDFIKRYFPGKKKQLHLFLINKIPNPHVSVLAGDCYVKRTLSPQVGKESTENQYTLIGMKDLFIDLAGIQKLHHPSRQALGKLDSGSLLTPVIQKDQIELLNNENVAVAQLSKVARLAWGDRLDQVREVKVIAMAKRYKNDIADTAFKRRCFGETWEMPVVEICSSAHEVKPG